MTLCWWGILLDLAFFGSDLFSNFSHLGIRVRYLDSYYIITEFEENFYNDEDGFFELGDVITSLAGTALRGKVVDLQKLFTKECRTLLRFEIAKLRFKDGTLFKPILTILKKRGLENMLSPSKSHDYKSTVSIFDVFKFKCELRLLRQLYFILLHQI